MSGDYLNLSGSSSQSSIGPSQQNTIPWVWSSHPVWGVRFMSRSFSGGTSGRCCGPLVYRTSVCTICVTRQLPSL
jgi:hypothetical protein